VIVTTIVLTSDQFLCVSCTICMPMFAGSHPLCQRPGWLLVL